MKERWVESPTYSGLMVSSFGLAQLDEAREVIEFYAGYSSYSEEVSNDKGQCARNWLEKYHE